jgi:two-component system CheB/CheR fusion protein
LLERKTNGVTKKRRSGPSVFSAKAGLRPTPQKMSPAAEPSPAGGPPLPLGEDGGFSVVGVGASAGGLDAFTRFLKDIPPAPGMAFVLIQHLDPHHASVMAELLRHRTSMTVVQAVNGMPLERDHVYVIPPKEYLAVTDGVFQLSPRPLRKGPRLPFDFFLHSLSAAYGDRAPNPG